MKINRFFNFRIQAVMHWAIFSGDLNFPLLIIIQLNWQVKPFRRIRRKTRIGVDLIQRNLEEAQKEAAAALHLASSPDQFAKRRMQKAKAKNRVHALDRNCQPLGAGAHAARAGPADARSSSENPVQQKKSIQRW